MECLECGGKTKVRESTVYGDTVYRKRECLECGNEFYTEELVVG